MMKILADSWERLKVHSLTRLVLLSVLVGVVAGFGALAFNFALVNEVFLVPGAWWGC